MARPLRLEFAGPLYHRTARGDGREAIYRAADDRRLFLDVLAGVWGRCNWTILAFGREGQVWQYVYPVRLVRGGH